MDADRFDAFTEAIGTETSRRGLLARLTCADCPELQVRGEGDAAQCCVVGAECDLVEGVCVFPD